MLNFKNEGEFLNNNRIEKRSVAAIERICVLDKGGRLEPKIPTSDKDISFDGGIEVHKNDTLTKRSFLYKVPVQVKGTAVKKFSGNTAKFRKLEREDLENYLQENGVLFFYVEVDIHDFDKNKVYCYPLLPVKICEMLEKKQKTYTIECTNVKDNKNDLYEYCTFFKKNSDRQSQVKNPEYFKKFDFVQFVDQNLPLTMSIIGGADENLFFSPFGQVYFNDKGMDRPVSNFKLKNYITEDLMEFSFNKETRFLNKKTIKSKSSSIINFNNVLYVTFNNTTPEELDLTINIKSSSLLEKKDVLLFLKKIDDNERTSRNFLFEQLITFLNQVIFDHSIIYEFFSIDEKSTVNLSDDDDSVARLLTVITESESVFDQVKAPGFYSLPFGDLNLMICLDIENKKIIPAFSREVEEKKGVFVWQDLNYDDSDYNPLFTSIYFSLFQDVPENDRVHKDLDTKRIIRSFMNNSNFKNEDTAFIINHAVLNAIRKYDLCLDKKYLEIAKALCNELRFVYPNNPYYTVNCSQIEYRQADGFLSDKTTQELVNLKYSHPENIELHLAISILLKEVHSSKILYSKLDSFAQNNFSKFPIFSLSILKTH